MTGGDKKQKFMFDVRNFDAPKKNETEEPPEPTYTETEVEKIKQDSFLLGKAQGLQEAELAREEVLLSVMKHIETLLKDLIANEDRREKEKNVEVVNLSLNIVQKLFPKLIEENTIEEIENMVLDTLNSRQEEARIVITVNDNILDLLKERIDKISDNAGFQGKIILIGTDNMLKSDCRVEWANGGAERNCENMFSVIENILSKQLPNNDLD